MTNKKLKMKNKLRVEVFARTALGEQISRYKNNLLNILSIKINKFLTVIKY